mmetsp:Transcript_11419/g.32878  ORF Transcript_11419/g.32878 Transcript_11419/m.32878 type:complete len:345 (+) Transcript_11419:648-1682(+)
MKDVVSNLCPPARFHLVATDFLDFGHPLLLGNGDQLRLEPIHSQIFVHGLASLLCALDVQTTGQVLDADGRFHLVDVLATRTTASHRGDLQVLVGNDNVRKIRLVQKDGSDVHSRKGCLPFVVGVEGRQTNQSMRAFLALEPAVGVFRCPVTSTRRARHDHFHALESYNVPLLFVLDLDGVSHFFGVSFVHAFQIRHPVVGFRASGSGRQQNPTGLVVVGSTQQEFQLVAFSVFQQFIGRRLQFFHQGIVFFLGEERLAVLRLFALARQSHHLESDLAVVLQSLPLFHPGLETSVFAESRRNNGISRLVFGVPKRRLGRFRFQLFHDPIQIVGNSFHVFVEELG